MSRKSPKSPGRVQREKDHPDSFNLPGISDDVESSRPPIDDAEMDEAQRIADSFLGGRDD